MPKLLSVRKTVTLCRPRSTPRIPKHKRECMHDVIWTDVQCDLILILILTHLTAFLEDRVAHEKMSNVSAAICDLNFDQPKQSNKTTIRLVNKLGLHISHGQFTTNNYNNTHCPRRLPTSTSAGDGDRPPLAPATDTPVQETRATTAAEATKLVVLSTLATPTPTQETYAAAAASEPNEIGKRPAPSSGQCPCNRPAPPPLLLTTSNLPYFAQRLRQHPHERPMPPALLNLTSSPLSGQRPRKRPTSP